MPQANEVDKPVEMVCFIAIVWLEIHFPADAGPNRGMHIEVLGNTSIDPATFDFYHKRTRTFQAAEVLFQGANHKTDTLLGHPLVILRSVYSKGFVSRFSSSTRKSRDDRWKSRLGDQEKMECLKPNGEDLFYPRMYLHRLQESIQRISRKRADKNDDRVNDLLESFRNTLVFPDIVSPNNSWFRIRRYVVSSLDAWLGV